MGNSSSRRSSKQDILIRYPKTNESQSSTAERNSPWSERVECNSPSSTAGLDSLSSTVELESSSSKEELESPSSTVGSKSRLPSTESESTKTSDLFPYLAASPLTAPRTTLKLHHFQKEAHFGIPKSLLGSVDQEKRLSHCIAGGDGPTLKDTENRNTKDVDLVSLGQAGYHTDSLIADKSCLKTAIGANDVNDRVRSNTETGVKPLQLGITCSTEATRTAAAKPPVLKPKNLATYANAGKSSTGSSDSLARENIPQSTKLVANASTTEDQATQKHFDDRAILAFIPFSPLEVDISLLVGQFQGRHKRRPVFSTKLSAILASKPYQVSLRHEKGALFASRIMSVPKGPVKTPHSQSSSGTQQKGNRAAAKEAKTSVKKPMTPEREVLNLLKATSELPLSKIVPQYKLEYGKTLNYEGKLISWLSSIPDVQVDASKQTVSLRTASRTCSDKNVTHKVRSSSVSSSKEEKRVREADVANSCAQVVSSGAPAVDLRCDASKSHASTPPREEAASSSANPAPQPAKSALGDSVSESAGPTTGTELASFRSRVLDLVKCDNLSVVELYNKYMDVYNEPPKFVDGSLSDALREVPGLRLAGGLLNVMPDSKEIVGSMLENLVSTEPCSLAELTARFKTRYGCLPPATFPLEEYLNMPDKFKLDGSLVSKAEPLPAATSGSLNVVPKGVIISTQQNVVALIQEHGAVDVLKVEELYRNLYNTSLVYDGPLERWLQAIPGMTVSGNTVTIEGQDIQKIRLIVLVGVKKKVNIAYIPELYKSHFSCALVYSGRLTTWLKAYAEFDVLTNDVQLSGLRPETPREKELLNKERIKYILRDDAWISIKAFTNKYLNLFGVSVTASWLRARRGKMEGLAVLNGKVRYKLLDKDDLRTHVDYLVDLCAALRLSQIKIFFQDAYGTRLSPRTTEFLNMDYLGNDPIVRARSASNVEVLNQLLPLSPDQRRVLLGLMQEKQWCATLDVFAKANVLPPDSIELAEAYCRTLPGVAVLDSKVKFFGWEETEIKKLLSRIIYWCKTIPVKDIPVFYERMFGMRLYCEVPLETLLNDLLDVTCDLTSASTTKEAPLYFKRRSRKKLPQSRGEQLQRLVNLVRATPGVPVNTLEQCFQDAYKVDVLSSTEDGSLLSFLTLHGEFTICDDQVFLTCESTSHV